MRPTRLELAGFTSFRDRTVVDFDGAELFALTGPTGAGKSSLVDALCFALYGSVPRYDDRKLVAPVISQGRLEAKVRLDFAVDGVEHTAVRVVRRTAGGGATTKEARLQRGGTTLAGDANAVTAQVEALLGLAFEQFTTCVVLPQGEFDRFLHDTPARRQELLMRLLDLGLYQRIAQAARQRAALASERGLLLKAQLDDLTDATPEARAALADRLSRLDDLRADMDAAKPHIDALAERARRSREQQRDDEQRAERLETLAAPAGLSDLAGSARAATADLDAAQARLTEAERRLADSEQLRDDLPDAAALRGLAADHAERERLAQDRPGRPPAAGPVLSGLPATGRRATGSRAPRRPCRGRARRRGRSGRAAPRRGAAARGP